MKKAIYIVVSIAFMLITNTVYAQNNCANGDLEFGNLNNWKARSGQRNANGIQINTMVGGKVPGRHTIMTAGFDPNVGGNLLPMVSSGTYSVRLGNTGTGSEAEVLSYTFTVTTQNQDFGFRYAMVMDDPVSHDPDEKPFFSYVVLAGSSFIPTATNVIGGKQFVADRNNQDFVQVPGSPDRIYRNWTSECMDLSTRLGQQVTIVFATGDCALGGHYGYAYIDDICGTSTALASAVSSFDIGDSFCLNEDIFADGSPSLNDEEHIWSIQELDAQGNPVGQPVVVWSGNKQAGIKDIKAMYENHGGVFECDKEYKVKLAVKNNCTAWQTSSHTIRMDCPNFSTGEDIVLCCDDLKEVTLGDNEPNADWEYEWRDPRGELISNEANYTFNPTKSGTYSLTVVDPVTGCIGTRQVSVYIMGDYDFEIVKTFNESCNAPVTLTAQLKQVGDCDEKDGLLWQAQKALLLNYQWSDNQTGRQIKVNPQDTTTYTVDVSFGCYSESFSIEVAPCHAMTGAIPDSVIIFPNSFSPNGDGVNDTYNVTHIGFNNVPAYNAMKFKFTVFDRWGRAIAIIEDETTRCEGFVNGTIPNWDGRTTENICCREWWNLFGPPNVEADEPLEPGLYEWRLDLWNCSEGWDATFVGEEVTIIKNGP